MALVILVCVLELNFIHTHRASLGVEDSQNMSKQLLEENYAKADKAVKPVFRKDIPYSL